MYELIYIVQAAQRLGKIIVKQDHRFVSFWLWLAFFFQLLNIYERQS